MASTLGNHAGMEIDEATISEAGRRLVGASSAGTRVILFGSYARGDVGKHSDLDY
jgi:predicted nucleotidyltransferase